ncbi:winged helix DNA-binding domain-containing protein [Streptomyces sp. NPDC056049]|uniref:winged helix DNA-binding domain-containing protein n=1 Tax=Streptomyces sp. NPDC056049 TaxID=3345693 RepID=UPI0035DB1B88
MRARTVETAETVTWDEARALRARRHGLAAPLEGAPVPRVVAAMCGAHAQVMSAAELSVGLRSEGATRTSVREALWEHGTLVKTYGPRGTVHLLPTADLPMWTGALAAIPPSPSPFPEKVRMTAAQTDEVVEAIGAALKDAALTVDELGEEVVARAGSWAGDLVMPAFQGFWPRWRQAIPAAANSGVLCFGANRGRKVTYTDPGRLLPGLRPDEGRAALAELVGRYLYAYGPATPQHFAQWLAAPRAWATGLFAALAEQGALREVTFEGTPAWRVADDTEAAPEPVRGVRLLPYFDAYVIGSHPRARLFPGRAAERALSGGAAGPYPVLLVDGLAAGVWHQRRSGRKIHITVEPLDELSAATRRALDEQVERTALILEGKPELTIGPVTVGPHA